jgi:serine/threonine protein kinase
MEKPFVKPVDEKAAGIYAYLQRGDFDGIPQIFDIQKTDHGCLVFMERLQGHSLAQEMMQKDFTDQEILDLARKLEGILTPLHEEGIIHRDLKPEHIFFTCKGLYIIDFDAARLSLPKEKTDRSSLPQSRDTTLLGTPGYASPEQFGFQKTSAASDVYALARIIQELDTKDHFTYAIRHALEMDPKLRTKTVHDFVTDMAMPAWIVPGISNPSLAGKITGWIWTALCLWICLYSIQTRKTSLFESFCMFFAMYGFIFWADNPNKFVRFPDGSKKAMRTFYSLGAGLCNFLLWVLVWGVFAALFE